MIEDRISGLIKMLLKDNERLFIPGLGTLTQKHEPARYDSTTLELKPPSFHFTLDRSLHYDDPYLAECYSWYEDVSLPKAMEDIQLFGEKIQIDLLVKGTASIPGVVDFSRDGTSIEMIPNADLLEANKLPVISMTDIWEIESRPRKIIWEFGAFAAILLLVLGYVFYLITPVNEPDILRNTIPIIGSLDDTVKIQETELATDLTSMDTNEEISDPNQPVIIVGCFSEAGNIQRMRDFLAQNGLQIYEETLKTNLVRIGIVPKLEENVEEVLGLTRQKIEPEAWVLVKK